ncbi:hypothetical protein RBU61_14030 [Tissierella sp. MB52-C2]|uniref:hypothetical protein n=1 Tax=Tissierella sp. MB52-C2 TaxID=3070999 RepID=UPI00280ADFFB|nr:hypothetical protein [Tissierella sp. MB52-C2]WMM24034.1 hypothetical protein RBU61_14030 [Tissierella sp. MB52-C2]
MIETSLKVTEVFLEYPIVIAKVVVCTFFFLKLIKSDFTLDLAEICISLIKCLAYGALAWFIFVNTKELERIDVLTYFTFLLACIETAHNFANSVGLYIVGLIKILFKKSIGEKYGI